MSLDRTETKMIATTLPDAPVMSDYLKQAPRQSRNPLRVIAGSRPLTLFILVATVRVILFRDGAR